MAKTSTFRKGVKEAIEAVAGDGLFISVKADEALSFASLIGLDDLISADMHQFWDVNPAAIFHCLGGDDCPGCKLGNDPGFKAYLPIVTRDGDVKIFPIGISIVRQLDEYESEVGSIAGKVIKIRRVGSGLKARYTVVPLGKELDITAHDIPDVEAALQPTGRKEIVELLKSRGLVGASASATEDTKADAEDWEDF